MVIACKQEEQIDSSFQETEIVNGLKTPSMLIKEKSPRRHVIFAEDNEIFEIPHLGDFSQDEIKNVWMSPQEFAAIRSECKKIIMAFQHDSRLVRGIELRGLENHLVNEQKLTEELQDLLYETVDRLMMFKDETSLDMSDVLAEMCQKITSTSEASAHQRALQDEMNACLISNE